MSKQKSRSKKLPIQDILNAEPFSIPRWKNVYSQREFYAKQLSDGVCYQIRCLFVNLKLIPASNGIDFGTARGLMSDRTSRHAISWYPGEIPSVTSATVGDILDCKTPEELQALFETEYAIQAINS